MNSGLQKQDSVADSVTEEEYFKRMRDFNHSSAEVREFHFSLLKRSRVIMHFIYGAFSWNLMLSFSLQPSSKRVRGNIDNPHGQSQGRKPSRKESIKDMLSSSLKSKFPSVAAGLVGVGGGTSPGARLKQKRVSKKSCNC